VAEEELTRQKAQGPYHDREIVTGYNENATAVAGHGEGAHGGADELPRREAAVRQLRRSDMLQDGQEGSARMSQGGACEQLNRGGAERANLMPTVSGDRR
jgi:hypothetical protein